MINLQGQSKELDTNGVLGEIVFSMFFIMLHYFKYNKIHIHYWSVLQDAYSRMIHTTFIAHLQEQTKDFSCITAYEQQNLGI